MSRYRGLLCCYQKSDLYKKDENVSTILVQQITYFMVQFAPDPNELLIFQEALKIFFMA